MKQRGKADRRQGLTPAEIEAIAAYQGEVTVCPPSTYSDAVVEKSWQDANIARSRANRARHYARNTPNFDWSFQRAGSRPKIWPGRTAAVDTMIAARTWADKEVET